jgi:hypothetical protein
MHDSLQDISGCCPRSNFYEHCCDTDDRGALGLKIPATLLGTADGVIEQGVLTSAPVL